ncbi:hypothetical protein NLJ89_g975 [Agrocybe chaxingu]|uniref:F-box domain-containing protein n=1 Tax=Agrocybe chaxingu TaxID=84603 RepID=A0A9W8N0U4_9AGAR|nr:hypothetical protein NLJ89_g975 [Agrocybe chaxingu]
MPALLRTHRNTMLTKPRDITACRLRNRLLPALQLCPDLLEYLFLLGASLETDGYHRRRAVLAYSQVCHDWRTAALATKSLWVQLTDFDDMSWRWNEEMLCRSHPLPVKVGSCTFPPRETNSITSEMGYLGRIRTYRLGFADESWDVLEKKIQEPAENLEYLSLAYVPLHSSKTNRPWYILPRNLFDNRAPQLRRLKLEGCTLDFGAPTLRSLTSLTVLNLDAIHKLAPSAFDWITLISTLPFLTDLLLKEAISSVTSLSDPHAQLSTMPSSKTRLSRLTSLHLEANISAVAAFLKFTILPVPHNLSLTCSDAQPGAEIEGILEAFVDVLERAIRRQRETGNTYLPLLIYARSASLSICTDERVLGNERDLPYPSSSASSFNFYLDFHAHRSGCWEPLLTPVLSAFSDPVRCNSPPSVNNGVVSHITSLEMRLPSCHPALAAFLRKATQLEALVNLPATLTNNLLPELRFAPPHRSHSPSPSITSNTSSSYTLAPLPSMPDVPLPHLRTISFNDDKSAWGVPYGTLLSYLRWRSEDAEAPLSRVVFRRCLLLDEKVSELEGIGVTVECDGEGVRWQNF